MLVSSFRSAAGRKGIILIADSLGRPNSTPCFYSLSLSLSLFCSLSLSTCETPHADSVSFLRRVSCVIFLPRPFLFYVSSESTFHPLPLLLQGFLDLHAFVYLAESSRVSLESRSSSSAFVSRDTSHAGAVKILIRSIYFVLAMIVYLLSTVMIMIIENIMIEVLT